MLAKLMGRRSTPTGPQTPPRGKHPSRSPALCRETTNTVRAAGLACSLALLGACSSDTSPKDPIGPLVHDDPSGVQFAKLDAAWTARFHTGDVLFDQVFLDSQGLGPVYIRPACASCHADDARGPGVVRKMVVIGDDGAPLSDQSSLPFGHTVRPQMAAGSTVAIDVPSDTSHLLITRRTPPAVFGRGYLEAIADSEIERVQAEQAERSDGVSGRINWVTYASEPNPDTRYHAHTRGERLIGRFGLKARVATLDDFAADAYQGDMGITSDLRPDELPNPAANDDELPGIDIPAEIVNSVADYMRLLRIPTRDKKVMAGRGAKLFDAAHCNSCHVPSLHTRADYPIAQLADQDAPVYTDMLLHDMGRDFADGMLDYSAESSEWRTAPLLGLRHLRSYLHDGRAKNVEEAIELHGAEGSEAATSLRAFHDLTDNDRGALIEFVSAL